MSGPIEDMMIADERQHNAIARLERERDEARAERDELKAVVLQIVDRIVPLTPIVLAALNSREGE